AQQAPNTRLGGFCVPPTLRFPQSSAPSASSPLALPRWQSHTTSANERKNCLSSLSSNMENAKPSDLDVIEISPSGFGLHFPKLDADVWVPALLEGVFGSTRWMAARLGARGGRVKSRAKARAVRANGRLGGRPRKKRRTG